MKKSAVEWYEIEINSLIEKYEAKEISQREFITIKHNLFYDAKEMEKQLNNELLNLIKDCRYKVDTEVPFGKEDAYDAIINEVKKYK